MNLRTPVWKRAELQKTSRPQYLRPLLFVVGILGLFLLLAVLLSGPAHLRVVIQADCAGFTSPVQIPLSVLANGGVRFYWYSADLIGGEKGSASRKLSPSQIDSDEPPSIVLTPAEDETPLFQLLVGPGVEIRLKGRDGGQLLQLSHQHGGSVTGTADVKSANLRLAHLGSPRGEESIIDIENQTIPSKLTVNSIRPPRAELPAYAEIPFSSAKSMQPELADGTNQVQRWYAEGCQSVQVFRESPSETIGGFSGKNSTLEVGWIRPVSMSVEIPPEIPRLQIHSSGTVRSIRENGREMLPSAIDELAGRSAQQKGVLGVLGAVILLAAGIFMKRALDLLAKLILPDQKG